MHQSILGLLLAASFAASQAAPAAPARAQFRARLAPVPIDLTMQSTIAGNGAATAVLTGQTLVVTGTFANLKSPATFARIHIAPKGMRGPAALDLQVAGGTSGTISGKLQLTASQAADLMQSRFYIQLHSEKAPDGNLWGWLLPEEKSK